MPTVLYPEALRIGLAFLAAGMAALAFAWHRQGLPPRRLAALLGLRAAVLLVLLVLLCRPVWIGDGGDGETPRIAVLIDRSESMALVEGGESRYVRAARFAREKLVAAVRSRGWQADLHEFAESAVPIEAAELGAGRPDGRVTDLGRAVEHALAASETPPLAVVALTDGVANAHKRDATALASLLASHGVFVGIAVGEERDLATLTLERLVAPTRAAPGEAYALSTRIRAASSGEVPAFDLLLFRDGRLVDQRRVAPRTGSHSWTEDFERVEDAEGTHRYTVRIVPGEASGPVLLRSEANTYVRVAKEDEIRLLFVQGALTWDFKFIHLSLAEDSVLKLTGVSRTSERSVFRQGVEDRDELAEGLPDDAADLAPFRVVVLAGLDAADLRPAQQEALARYVSEMGGGVLLLGGPNTFTPAWRGSRLEELLPVRFEEERGVVGVDAPFRLELTEDALRDSVFRVSDTEAVAAVWEGLPAFDSYGRVAEAKPGATVWAVHERDTGASGRRILMATQRYGAGLTAVVALENFWRWRLDRDGEPDQYDRFWRQLLRYLAQIGRSEINVFFPGQDLQPGGEVRAVIERRGGDAAAGPLRHRVSVLDPSGKSFAEQEVELARGDSATVRFDAREEGVYQVRVEWPGGPLPVVEPVEIRAAGGELERTARELETLEQWASSSGGFAAVLEDSDDVGRMLDGAEERARAMRRKDRPPEAAGLGPFVFFALLAAIAAETALRVRFGLL
jgi:uncharacterized membrane protein